MNNYIKKCCVEHIEPIGDDGMQKATLMLDGHGACIEVIGKNLTELVERTYIIIQAFNTKK